jgi:hypothetical protein
MFFFFFSFFWSLLPFFSFSLVKMLRTEIR